MPQPLIVVPESVMAMGERSVGNFFSNINGMSGGAAARDHLDVQRPFKKAEILETYTSMQGKRLLEIGCGFGVNLATWIKKYDLDGYGTEQDAEGFESSFKVSQALFVANGLDPERVQRVSGNFLPFADASFDIVYAANVLEHTQDPVQVLEEAVRILRPGGILHTEIPNYLSYFEGHYMVPQPPIVWRWVLPAWLRVLGRDPTYARSIRTEINPVWCRRAVKLLSRKYPVQLLSLGEEIFLDRLGRPFDFDMERTANRLSGPIGVLQRVNVSNWIGRLIVLAKGHYPLYLTLRREA
jgi:SAM-dependent methyltransferase